MRRLSLFIILCLPVALAGCKQIDKALGNPEDPVVMADKLDKAVKSNKSKNFCRLLREDYRKTFRFYANKKIYNCSLRTFAKTEMANWKDWKLFHSKVLSKDKYKASIQMNYGPDDVAASAWRVDLVRKTYPDDAPWRVVKISRSNQTQFGIG